MPTASVDARRSRDRGARPRRPRPTLDPRRARRLHRQHRLQVRRLRHQAPRRGDRALVRDARRARRAGQHPSHRLPSFLRAALHRRHRAARLQGAGRPRTATRSRAITSWSAAASGRTPRSAARSTATSRPRTRRKTVERMLKAYLAHRASREESVPGLRAPPRDRRAQGRCSTRRPRHEHHAASADPRHLVPESAPFSPEQRAWLNGFFAGLSRLERRRHARCRRRTRRRCCPASPPAEGAPPTATTARPGTIQTMPLAERMKLAEGRPLRAPHDGGDGAAGLRPVRLQLRGLCRRAVRQEGRAAEPVRAGRQGNRPHAQERCTRRSARRRRPRRGAAAATVASAVARAGRSRDNPVDATFLSRTRLNKPGSDKETWHVEFDLAECGLDYAVGDASASFPPTIPRWSMP